MQAEESSIEEARLKVEDLRFQIQTWKDDLKEVEFEERAMNDKLSLYDRNKADSHQEQELLQQRRTVLQEKLEQQSKKLSELDKEIALVTEQKNKQTVSKESVVNTISDLRIQSAAKRNSSAMKRTS